MLKNNKIITFIIHSLGQANMGGNPRPWVDQIKDLGKQNTPSEEEENLGEKEHEWSLRLSNFLNTAQYIFSFFLIIGDTFLYRPVCVWDGRWCEFWGH